MYLLSLFNIGKSAIFTSQTALNVTSHNIANVNTPGFSRQEAVLEVSTPIAMRGGFLGSGVNVEHIRRHYDNFIQSQLLGQYQNYGRSTALEDAFSQIEQIFNEAKNMGLSVPLSDFFNSWQDLSANPEGQTQRTVLLQKTGNLVIAAKRMERGIIDNLSNLNQQISDIVNRVNTIASQIADLNERIISSEGSFNTGQANDLRDQRQNLLNELSQLVEASSYEEKDGSINISVGMKSLVYKGEYNALSVKIDEEGNREIYLENSNITLKINKGQIGGIISARDTIQDNQLKGLRRFIASLIKEINLIHQNGYGLDGTTGNNFFNPLDLSIGNFSSGASITGSITSLSQLTLDEYEITFDGSGNYHVLNKDTDTEVATGAYISGNPINFDGISITITGAVNSNDKFSVSPLTGVIQNFGTAISDYRKIAASGSYSGLPGDNTNALNIINLAEKNLSELGGKTFTGFYKGIVSDIAMLTSSASDSLTFDAKLLEEINMRRESISGVSLDEEAANLIKYQRAFEAGARIIKVTDELLQTIMNL